MKTKTIVVALATLLIGSLCFWACQKEDIQQVKPDVVENIVLKTGQAEPVMVPFRGSGTWWYAAPPNIEGNEVVLVVGLEGRATHLGRFQGVETYRFSYDPDGVMGMIGDYLSHSSTYTAANGDELQMKGCVDEHGSVHNFYEPLGTGFSLTGVHIVGGTGRFENAVGGYDFWVNKSDPTDPGGTWKLEGEISFGKMAPLRGSGTYQFAGLDIVDGVVVLDVEIEGRATRLGRLEGFETMRFSYDPDGVDGLFGDYLSSSSIWIAANGDELHDEGSVEHGSVLQFHEPLGTGFSLTGVHIVGGTGRFKNAVGWHDIWINHTPGGTSGTWVLEGGISN